jgi:poly-beta-1,6-N-acetyl-D-glucosamine synthase
MGLTLLLVFWAAVGVVVYAYLGYPALIAAAAGLRPGPAVRKADALPGVSVLLVARDEERHLPAKLRNLAELDYPRDRLELLVVSDGSRDGTEAVATGFGPGITLLALPEPRGKAAALNQAVPRARGEILVLTDARQTLEPDAVRRLVAYFADPTVGAVSGELHLLAAAGTPARGLGWYWRYEKLIRRAESRFDSTVGVTGALYAVRKSLFVALDPATILDDVALPMEVVLAGYRVLFAPEARAWDRVAEDPGLEYRRKVRTLAGNCQLLRLRPALLDPVRNRLLWQLLSHKLARLAVPWCLLVALLSSGWLAFRGEPLYTGLLLAQLLFYLLAAVGGLRARQRRRLRLSALPYAFVLLNLAAAGGLVGFLRGTETAAWKSSA